MYKFYVLEFSQPSTCFSVGNETKLNKNLKFLPSKLDVVEITNIIHGFAPLLYCIYWFYMFRH
jgi:hypothetical protein